MSYQDWLQERRFVESERGFWRNIKLPVIDFKEQHFVRDNFWQHIPSKEALQALIKTEPLTPHGLELIGRFVKISAVEMTGEIKPEARCYFLGFHDGFPLYKALINLARCDTKAKQIEALFHEMCHIYYRTGGGVRNIEEIIQNETLRFLKEEEDYVNCAFMKFLAIPGYSYQYNTNQLPLPLVLKQ